jgi:uncharacterized protein (DUF1810 family)
VADLERFIDAQDGDHAFAAALDEMRAGGKRSHWIWYVFPQLSGLGTSPMAQRYAIHDRAEAVAYLKHPVLCPRLLAVARAAAAHLGHGADIKSLMGSAIDAAKLTSSMTLFGQVAGELREEGHEQFSELADLAQKILAAAEVQGFPPCRHTISGLAARGGRRPIDEQPHR